MPQKKKGASARAGAATGQKARWTPEQRAARGKAPARPRGAVRSDNAERRSPDGAVQGRRPTSRRPEVDPRPVSRRPDVDPRSASRRPEVDPRPVSRRQDVDPRPVSRRPEVDPRPVSRRQDFDPRPVSRRQDVDHRPASRRPAVDPRRSDGTSWRPRTEAPGAGRRTFESRPPRPRYDRVDARAERREAPQARPPIREDVVLDRLEARAIEAHEVEGIGFGDLGLGANIVRVLAELGATAPFPIQAAAIPAVLDGRDVLARGRTGSGKTIAFGAPLVERLLRAQKDSVRRAAGRSPRALILAPTRELALQIDRTVQPLARSVGLFTTQIYGGVPYSRQLVSLQRGIDIVVGTPGRIQDLVAQGRLDLSNIVVTVLDEADHMCDLGFLEPVKELLRATPAGGQRLLFSATLDSGVSELVEEFLVEPSIHEVAGEDAGSADIAHHVFVIDQRDKQDVLAEVVAGSGRTLVFARTRAFTEQLAEMLERAGIAAESIHGDLKQSQRNRALEAFSRGRVAALVATDVAARGIHVDDVDLVVQADAPDDYKTYLHRSGRTGRAGKTGVVVTLVPRQRRRRTEELLGRAGIEAQWDFVAPGDPQLRTLVE
jgi:superfamily II DNA/RNA helicase